MEKIIEKKNRVAVIFSGGKSSRMGEDKALLPFGKYNSLAEYQYRRLSKIFNRVYLSSKSNKFEFKANIVKDNYIESSPLVALASIFENLNIDELFVLSVDAPFVGEEIIDTLYDTANDSSVAIIAESNHGVEPLCGIYRRTILTKAKEALTQNNHRLYSLLKEVNFQKVKIEGEGAFMNLNYPSEYEKALELKKS